MNIFTRALRLILRTCAAGAVVIGLMLWSGIGPNLVRVHMGLGALLVVSLVALAMVGRQQDPSWYLPTAVLLGIAIAVLGVTQPRLLPGSSHFLVQAIHLLLGLAGAALGERLARGTTLVDRSGPDTVPQSP